MPITLKQLKVFHTIALHGTVQQASEILFLSKSTLSMALQQLEKQLDEPLFDRVNNRLVLNSQGKKLLPMADELLQRAQQIVENFNQKVELQGTLHIGASNSIGNYLLPALLGQFLEKYPDCQPKVTIANTRVLTEDLLDFKLDICLIEGNPIHSNIQWSNWLTDEMYLVCHPKHGLAQRHREHGVLHLRDFEFQEWIIRENGSGSREYFDVYVVPYLKNWTVRLELNQSEAILGACRAGLGIGYLPNNAVLTDIQQGRLYHLPYPIHTQRQLRIGIHHDKYLSPLLKHFRDFCLNQVPVASTQPIKESLFTG